MMPESHSMQGDSLLYSAIRLFLKSGRMLERSCARRQHPCGRHPRQSLPTWADEDRWADVPQKSEARPPQIPVTPGSLEKLDVLY
jgi:hypothetical protein